MKKIYLARSPHAHDRPYAKIIRFRARRLPTKTLTASDARANLFRLLDEAADSHQPIQIAGKRNDAVLISEEDWEAVQETLYLLSIPGMRESIREGLVTPLEETSEDPGW